LGSVRIDLHSDDPTLLRAHRLGHMAGAAAISSTRLFQPMRRKRAVSVLSASVRILRDTTDVLKLPILEVCSFASI
jgi:hypothetical protein